MIEKERMFLVLVHLPINRRYPSPPTDVIQAYREPISRWAEEKGIPVLDGDALHKGAKNDETKDWFVDAVHPSAWGNEKMAVQLCTLLPD